MGKRLLVPILGLFCWGGAVAAFVFALIFFPSYEPIVQGLGFLLLGTVMLAMGINQVREAKRFEVPLVWWKHNSIFYGLSLECFGVFYLIIRPLNDLLTNEVLQNCIGVVFILLAVAPGIYASILTIAYFKTRQELRQQIAYSKRREGLRQLQAEQMKSPS